MVGVRKQTQLRLQIVNCFTLPIKSPVCFHISQHCGKLRLYNKHFKFVAELSNHICVTIRHHRCSLRRVTCVSQKPPLSTLPVVASECYCLIGSINNALHFRHGSVFTYKLSYTRVVVSLLPLTGARLPKAGGCVQYGIR
jgi:hypothetical protein